MHTLLDELLRVQLDRMAPVLPKLKVLVTHILCAIRLQQRNEPEPSTLRLIVDVTEDLLGGVLLKVPYEVGQPMAATNSANQMHMIRHDHICVYLKRIEDLESLQTSRNWCIYGRSSGNLNSSTIWLKDSG